MTKIQKNLKYCVYCNKYRLITNFYRRSLRKHLFHSKCRQCQKHDREQLRKEMIRAYGSKCSCCGERRHKFLTLDHINGLEGKKRKKTDTLLNELRRLNWPRDKYQLLCWNCNCAKGLYGKCPHQFTKKGKK